MQSIILYAFFLASPIYGHKIISLKSVGGGTVQSEGTHELINVISN